MKGYIFKLKNLFAADKEFILECFNREECSMKKKINIHREIATLARNKDHKSKIAKWNLYMKNQAASVALAIWCCTHSTPQNLTYQSCITSLAVSAGWGC